MVSQDGVSDERVHEPTALDDVDLPAKYLFQLGSHLFPRAAPRSPVAIAILEYDEHVDVAVGAKLTRIQHRPKETELPDPPLPAELDHRATVEFDRERTIAHRSSFTVLHSKAEGRRQKASLGLRLLPSDGLLLVCRALAMPPAALFEDFTPSDCDVWADDTPAHRGSARGGRALLETARLGRGSQVVGDRRSMLTGDIRNKVDAIWNAFWSGGISNPLEVIEQITYLLFIRRLDDLQMNEEAKASGLGKPIERRIFPGGKDAKKRLYADYRWSRFKHFEPKEMYEVVSEHVFPFLRTMGGEGSTYAQHMKDARFTIPTPALLAKVVDMLDKVPMEDRDTKGDLYEYMLGKIATAGQNGQFRTPRHIIQLMVELVAPRPDDVVCDPACGTAGFLVAVGEHR